MKGVDIMNNFNYPYNMFVNNLSNKNGMNPHHKTIGFIPANYSESYDSNEHVREITFPACK